MSQCWVAPMSVMLRYIIGDDTAPYTYSNDKIKNLIIVAAYRIQREIKFDATYTIDLSSMNISPDPVDASDVPFVNLTVLKAACILSRNQLKEKVDGAILWKDGQSSLDSTKVPEAQKALTDSICQEYEQAKMQSLIGDDCPGRVVLGPFSSDQILRKPHGGPFNSYAFSTNGIRSDRNY